VFRVLAIDGGGVRGIFPAHFLHLLEEACGFPLAESFDLLVGTSTGAIIAAAAAMHVPLLRVAQAYEVQAPAIFRKRRWFFAGLASSKYATRPLRSLLLDLFGDAPMAAAKQRLLIPTTDISNGNVFVIKSPYLPTFVRDKDILLAQAVLASCAAPSYFDPVRVREYLLADGGLWANNPSIVAYTEALGKLGVADDTVRILSIGTGTGHQYYDVGKHQRRWGLATGWQGPRIIDAVMSIQGRAASNSAALLLGAKYCRISFAETGRLPLDDVTCMARLRAKAGEAFTYNYEKIRTFLDLNNRQALS
jgi:patatin-like phospholipase/acyl hydrolase